MSRQAATTPISPSFSRSLQHRVLDRDEELALSRLSRSGDGGARNTLVELNQRLVLSYAKHYSGYGVALDDLVQAGNVGLLKGIDRFDPETGYRLSTYVSDWIKSELREYVLRNFRLVNAATTQATRKLFFRLRSDKALHSSEAGQAVAAIASRLDVTEQDVSCMLGYFRGGDYSQVTGEDEGCVDIFSTMDDEATSSDAVDKEIEQAQLKSSVLGALSLLSDRERTIISERFLVQDEEEKATLAVLASRFGVSVERVRQLEAIALGKLASSLEHFH